MAFYEEDCPRRQVVCPWRCPRRAGRCPGKTRTSLSPARAQHEPRQFLFRHAPSHVTSPTFSFSGTKEVLSQDWIFLSSALYCWHRIIIFFHTRTKIYPPKEMPLLNSLIASNSSIRFYCLCIKDALILTYSYVALGKIKHTRFLCENVSTGDLAKQNPRSTFQGHPTMIPSGCGWGLWCPWPGRPWATHRSPLSPWSQTHDEKLGVVIND